MTVKTNAPRVIRRLRDEPAKGKRAIPTALNAATRKARTKVAGVRGTLRREVGITRPLKGRVQQGKRANRQRMRTSLWFGGNMIPAEHLRGNIRARPGARNLTTKRDGAIPRSFAIRPGRNTLYMQRFGDAPGAYRRILTDVADEFRKARDEAGAEAERLFPLEMKTAIEKRRARERAKAAAK